MPAESVDSSQKRCVTARTTTAMAGQTTPAHRGESLSTLMATAMGFTPQMPPACVCAGSTASPRSPVWNRGIATTRWRTGIPALRSPVTGWMTTAMGRRTMVVTWTVTGIATRRWGIRRPPKRPPARRVGETVMMVIQLFILVRSNSVMGKTTTVCPTQTCWKGP